MKVLIAADASPLDDGSGAERVLQEHARELARREHEVRLLYRDSADTSYDGAEWEGCRLFPYAIDRRSNISFLRTTLRNGGRAAARATSDWAPEIINIQQPFTGFALLRAINPPLPPVFYTFLSPAPAEFIRLGGSKPGTRRSLVTRAIQRVENYVLSRADRISVLSAFMENEIQRWHPELDPRQIVRVPGGVDTARFAPLADRRGVRVRLGYPPDNKLLLTVRNLEPRTGVDTLVEAIGELARGRRDFLLLIAGRGPLREQLDRRVEQLEIGDLVRFLGFVPEEELVELYGIADAYIQLRRRPARATVRSERKPAIGSDTASQRRDAAISVPIAAGAISSTSVANFIR